MTNDAVEDALKGLAAELDIEVAPEFSARVRMAVEAQRPAVRGWIWGVVGVAAAASVALGVVMIRPAAVPEGTIAGPDLSAVASAKAEGPAYVRPVAVRRAVPRAADVAAPTEQALALNRLLLGLRSGRTHISEGTPAPVDQDGLLLTLTPIEIPLIRIAPIEISPLPAIEPLGPPEGQR